MTLRESQKQTDLGAKRLEGTTLKANTPRPPPTDMLRPLLCLITTRLCPTN
eukprot:UN27532